ncbi:MAG: hypothetical protein IT303_00160 [Dehalococcoidia bacterium]|nr:hypothetical protein [Dehalococcoidia bacterium]
MVMVYESEGRWHVMVVSGGTVARDEPPKRMVGHAGAVLQEVAARYPDRLAVLVSADWGLRGIPVAAYGSGDQGLARSLAS